MMHHSLIKLAEDKERRKKAILAHMTPSVGAGAALMGAGTMLASGHDSVFNKGERDSDIKFLEKYKKDKYIADTSHKLRNSPLGVGEDFAKARYDWAVRPELTKQYDEKTPLIVC
jgi:hypothetical protein